MKRMLVLMLALVCLCGCTPASVTREGVAMDTAVRLTLYDGSDAVLLDEAMAAMERYERLFSRTDPQSEIAQLNVAGGKEVALSQPVRDVLAQGKAWGERTAGALDITIAPVSRLWDFQAGVLPSADEVADAVPLVDYRALTVTETGARLPVGMAVDLGGLAKGYVADRLAESLRAAGVTSALLDLGGNIYALGDKNGVPFKVGIRDPFDANALVAVVPAEDCAVVTSGVYERCFEKEGVTYHHLLDPATGWPVQNGVAAVTVVTPLATDGDALSTACFVLGLEEGMALIESLPNTEALFVDGGGELHASSGLNYEKR